MPCRNKITKARKAKLYAVQQGLCILCGNKLPPLDVQVDDQSKSITIEHIIPLKRAVAGTKYNLGLSHWSCNNARGDSPLRLEKYVQMNNPELYP